MWKPKDMAYELKAKVIGQFLKDNNLDTKLTSEEFNVTVDTIYRYAKYLGIDLPRKRDPQTGRFTR